jgi:hypothetical protein
MRKIEQLMINAIQSEKSFKMSNTAVGTLGGVYLHGNMIGVVNGLRMQFSFAHWPTPTTKSRINALLSMWGVKDCVRQVKGQLYLGTMLINPSKWYGVDLLGAVNVGDDY